MKQRAREWHSVLGLLRHYNIKHREKYTELDVICQKQLKCFLEMRVTLENTDSRKSRRNSQIGEMRIRQAASLTFTEYVSEHNDDPLCFGVGESPGKGLSEMIPSGTSEEDVIPAWQVWFH